MRIINITARISPGAFRQESATHSATNHICGTLLVIVRAAQTVICDSFSELYCGRFSFRANNFAEDFSSFDSLDFRRNKTLGIQFFGARQFCFSFRQRFLKLLDRLCILTVHQSLTVLFFISTDRELRFLKFKTADSFADNL